MRDSIGTPWGPSQTHDNIGPDLDFYSTAGHGGYRAGGSALRAIDAAFPGHVSTAPGWYEEDCEWAFVACALPEHFDGRALSHAVATLRRNFPWHAAAIPAGVVDRAQAWESENAERWQIGCMGTPPKGSPSGSWWVSLYQTSSPTNRRSVLMPEYPRQALYTTAELNALPEA